MIIPSIDISDGHAVQLIGGCEKALDAGDPMAVAERFAVAGPMAVIDLDAAMGKGDNRAVIEQLVRRFDCRVGGGIRSKDAAIRWLDAGAQHIIIGTAAKPDLLSELPPERVIAALDARDGEVMVEGWQTATGAGVLERMAELKDLVSGFLVTFIEVEGRMVGTKLDQVEQLVTAAGSARLTVAGGVTTADEIAALDRLGADAQVGMALYTQRLGLAEAIAAPLTSDRADGLWPTVVVDEHGRALGLAWSSMDSLRQAVADRRGVYHSRRRGVWVKGETSGATQEILRVDVDCDRDALRFTVRQAGEGFCHTGQWTCWGDDAGLPRLAKRLARRVAEAPEGSYTKRLLADPGLLAAKLKEEGRELAAAQSPDHVAEEVADVVYFALVAMARAGVDLTDVEAALDRRERRISRRQGDAKAEDAS
ncbi:MAG: phosphoribosyl-ATP diphosphatase [Planctomycetota bacterium]|jgi:phosphoribosyl-ATP pyrophosphohydrolase